jgi:hypothetical protein
MPHIIENFIALCVKFQFNLNDVPSKTILNCVAHLRCISGTQFITRPTEIQALENIYNWLAK